MTGFHTYTYSGTQLCAKPPHTHVSLGNRTHFWSHADTLLVLILSEDLLVKTRQCALTYEPFAQTPTHTHTPCLAQEVRMFHKSGPACWGCAFVHCCNCVCAWVWVLHYQQVRKHTHTLTHTDSHGHARTGSRRSRSLITVVSKESPWQWQNETTACGRGGVWECVSICLCVSYRPRSGLFPQKESYSPQANQRTKSETEFNPIGPTRLTFITRGQSQGRGRQAGRWHHR